MDQVIIFVRPFVFAAVFIISLFWGIDCIVNNKKKQKFFAVAVSAISFALTCFCFALI